MGDIADEHVARYAEGYWPSSYGRRTFTSEEIAAYKLKSFIDVLKAEKEIKEPEPTAEEKVAALESRVERLEFEIQRLWDRLETTNDEIPF